ncbi:hypothetical protein [Oceanimonas sp. CAM02]|uniref:hypothetical protein n=1 Tax=Oceanimonas sp. CAM02 TaxID=3080336 RepID=UPI002935AA8C|nr:hypothetical protein [Oceanimonas sp. CAM02]MDV2857514.1 hypothetical protein [Oceanimonas sp. CAM02]
MSGSKIVPEKIKKPIHLLGAWLAGLFTVNGGFLIAATNMERGSFESIALVVAAIVNVPVFLFSVFLLQTKFRPELQEDHYYSTYLSQKTNEKVKVLKSEAQLAEVFQKLNELENKVLPADTESKGDLLPELAFGVNKNFGDYGRITSELASLGVIACTSFGSDNVPERRSVAIDRRVSRQAVREVLSIAGKLGFTHWGYFDNEMEETKEDVLLGAYGDHEFEII